jgi:hypothetical protein
MFLIRWLRGLQSRHLGAATSSGRTPKRIRPHIEVLEGRDLPSTLTVLNTNDSGPGSLRAEIAAAQSGDTIAFDSSLFVSPPTIQLTSGELAIDKNLNIQGAAPKQYQLGLFGYSVRDLNISAGVKVSVSGVQFDNINWGAGVPVQGGDIYNAGDLTLTDCTFNSGVAMDQGGAIYNATGASLSISHCVIVNCMAGQGGAIYNAVGASMAVRQSSIGSNSATSDDSGQGGAIYEAGGTVVITDSSMWFNTATGATALGGAIYVAGGQLQITGANGSFDNGTFSLDNQLAAGGFLYQAGGDVVITNSDFVTGLAGDALPLYLDGPALGGTIYEAGGTLSVTNCKLGGGALSGSVAQGGAIYEAGGTLTLTNCTLFGCIVESSAVAEGGAIYVAGGSLSIQHCAFENNTAGVGAPFQLPDAPDGVGGAIYIAGGSVCISENTSFTGDTASTSNPDVFGSFTVC